MRENVTPEIKSIGFDAVERICMVGKSCWMTFLGWLVFRVILKMATGICFGCGVNS